MFGLCLWWQLWKGSLDIEHITLLLLPLLCGHSELTHALAQVGIYVECPVQLDVHVVQADSCRKYWHQLWTDVRCTTWVTCWYGCCIQNLLDKWTSHLNIQAERDAVELLHEDIIYEEHFTQIPSPTENLRIPGPDTVVTSERWSPKMCVIIYIQEFLCLCVCDFQHNQYQV